MVILRAILMALVLAGSAQAQTLAPAQAQTQAGPEDWRAVIEGQIEALRADDYVTAFGFASPAIRGIFGTPEVFGRMVRQGYPMVHRPQGLRFLEAEVIGGRQVQKLLITDAAGASHLALYEMLKTPDGWKINGVRILPAPDLGV